MKKIILLTIASLLSSTLLAQTVGSTKTEQYKASFETAIDISQFMDYEGKQIPIQILKAGISDEMYEMYPELKEKRVGLGVANISMEYLENLNRFKFTEDKEEIKQLNNKIYFLDKTINTWKEKDSLSTQIVSKTEEKFKIISDQNDDLRKEIKKLKVKNTMTQIISGVLLTTLTIFSITK